jgi:hypothetical protein
MKVQPNRIALALAVTLIYVSPMVGGADATSAGSVDRAGGDRAATIVVEPTQESAGQPQVQDGRANRNGPHPAVLSYEHPVFPIKVPNPPVGLERY